MVENQLKSSENTAVLLYVNVCFASFNFTTVLKSSTHPTGGIGSQQGLTLSGFREASAVDVDAGELISRGGWSVVDLPSVGHH